MILNVYFALKLRNYMYIIKTSQMNPKYYILSSTTIHCRSLIFKKIRIYWLWKILDFLSSFKGKNSECLKRIKTIVNTNSKYKEDDFTDSDAVDYSHDMCIYFRPWSTHMSPSLLRSLLTPLHIPARHSDWNTGDDHKFVSWEQPWLLHSDDADT